SIASIERGQVDRCVSSRITSSFTSACAWRATSKMNENTPPPEPPSGQGMDYSEIADVHEVHAAVQREKREPRVGREPLSIWLVAVYGLAVFFGGANLAGTREIFAVKRLVHYA